MKMGVPVSKFKVTSQSLTLIVGNRKVDNHVAVRCHQSTATNDASNDIDSDYYKVRLIKSNGINSDDDYDEVNDEDVVCARQSNQMLHSSSLITPTRSSETSTPVLLNTSNESLANDGGTGSGTVHFNQPLKYIDDNDTTENRSFGKEVENDNDSGNASISSDNSHHEDSSNEYESKDEHEECNMLEGAEDDVLQLPKLRKHSSSRLNFCSSLTNRLSTASFAKRYSSQSVLSRFEHFNIRKIVSKLNPGDLIEIRCQCNCMKGSQLRASINNRQRFRRTLQRQSFHQVPLSKSTSFSSSKRQSTLSFSNVFRPSCISGSMTDLNTLVQSEVRSRNSPLSAPFMNTEQQCIEQFHYVFVEKIDQTTPTETKANKQADSAESRDSLLQNVWCFHVRPYQRVALLEDDRNLGVIKHETLESIAGQFLVEMEERHWQCGRGFRQPKLSIYYQIRNQDKLSQQILKQTLNAKPESIRIMDILHEIKDSHVRYHRTTCNSEHYCTLWKYGIGWSSWANGRADILHTLQQFLQRFSQLFTDPANSVQLNGGECLLEQTNLIVQCFGLQGAKLEDSIRQWIRSQIVIAKSPDSVCTVSDITSADNASTTTIRANQVIAADKSTSPKASESDIALSGSGNNNNNKLEREQTVVNEETTCRGDALVEDAGLLTAQHHKSPPLQFSSISLLTSSPSTSSKSLTLLANLPTATLSPDTKLSPSSNSTPI